MTPDSIHKLINQCFPDLFSERRSNPDGWSYFLGPKQGGAKSNRIFRAVSSAASQHASLKLSVSARLYKTKAQIFNGTESQLVELVKNEISLYKEHFGQQA